MSCIISAVVCTYNRSDMLKGCLESLCQQTLSKNLYEIIVVDNNSTDNTPKVVEEFSDQNVRYCIEMASGLSHARNRGFSEAKGKYVAYIDDDARAAADWLEIGYTLFENAKPSLDCLGGVYHPFYTSAKPDWFKDQYEVRGFGDSPQYLQRTDYLSGSNMIWPKDVLKMLGGFDTNTGVVGNRLRLGEETKALECLRSLKSDARILFSPDLIIYHWVPDYKMTVRYRLKRKFAEGQYQTFQLQRGSMSDGVRVVSVAAIALLKTSIRFILRIKAYPHWENWLVEDGGRVVTQSGKLLGIIGIFPRVNQS